MTKEEKLKEAKRLYKTANADQRYVLESLFPELVESEGERIRKTLIENFKWFCGDFPETSKWGKDDDLLVKDILTWLEKQGEQKPKWTEEDEENFRDIISAIHRVAYQTSGDEKARIKWIKSIKQRMNDKRRNGKCRK